MKPGDLVAGRYRMLRTIGQGGMGAVWAAHHELIDRDVAVKITDEKVASRSEVRDRFLNEARAVGRLRHPNVIDVMDFGELPDRRLYIVFELLKGQTLEQTLERSGHLSQFDAVTVAIEICRGLEAAHSNGIIHRDLKPANVFLHDSATGGTVVKLLDFGISKSYDQEGVSLSMTQTGMVVGTPQYMSAEQARGLEDIDVRTDVWGVGVLLYEMITTKIPFEGSNYNALLYKIMNEQPAPFSKWSISVPPALNGIVQRCLEKSRAHRYQTVKELRLDLEGVLASLPSAGAGFNIERTSGFVAAPPRGRASIVSLAPVPRIETPAPPAPSTETQQELPSSSEQPAPARSRAWAVGAGLAALGLGAVLWARQPSAAKPSGDPTAVPVATAPRPEPTPESPTAAASEMAPAARAAATAPVEASSEAIAADDRPERAPSASKKSKPAPAHSSTPRSKTPAPVTKVDNAGF